MLQAAPALLLASGAARAETFPARPIRYIVPVAPGGGIIASQNSARSAPDGYTLMQGYVATHGTSPATRHVPYDPIKDFTPIGMIGATPNVLVVNSALPVKTVAGFVAYVRQHAGKLSYRSAGQGSLTQSWAGRRRPCSPASPPRSRTSSRGACGRSRSLA